MALACHNRAGPEIDSKGPIPCAAPKPDYLARNSAQASRQNIRNDAVPGAANGHSKIIAVVANEAGQPVVDKLTNIAEHAVNLWNHDQEFDYSLIFSVSGRREAS